jgi:putative FmdB family regulatory protein
MPIYEFECSSCGARFDRLQKLSDPDPDTCPECGAPQVKRRLTAPAFRLAGSGWYETDFKKDGDKKRNLAGKDDAPKADAPKSDTAKKESGTAGAAADKPAAKPVSPKSDSA